MTCITSAKLRWHLINMNSETRWKLIDCKWQFTLQWRHNGCDCVPNHQPHDFLLNRLFICRSKKTSKLRVTGLCAGNSPVTSEFPVQMANNAENFTIWWRHHQQLPSGCSRDFSEILTLKSISFEAILNMVSDWLAQHIRQPFKSHGRLTDYFVGDSLQIVLLVFGVVISTALSFIHTYPSEFLHWHCVYPWCFNFKYLMCWYSVEFISI